jgi:putative flippase GtrA
MDMKENVGLRRWAAFNAVGILGLAVQLSVLILLVRRAQIHYLAATALAVETAVLHNFVWHERCTWRDRLGGSRVGLSQRLARFHLLNGAVSLLGNLALMRILTGAAGLDPVLSNLLAVLACSLLNFFGSDVLVFRRAPEAPRATVPAAALAFVLVAHSAAAAGNPGDVAVALEPATLAAWQEYERRVDERYVRTNATSAFFAHDSFASRDNWREAARKGGVSMLRIDAASPGAATPSVPDGRIHHWAGAVFVPGTSLDAVLRYIQDHAGREADSYEDVLASKLLARTGDELRVFMKLKRDSLITVRYNTEHVVRYRRVSTLRATSRSTATRIAELADGGTAREREKTPGSDQGFLWRLNAYWRYEQTDGGVLIECESVSLSRDVPMLLKPFISGMVERIARESLQKTLVTLRQVLAG